MFCILLPVNYKTLNLLLSYSERYLSSTRNASSKTHIHDFLSVIKDLISKDKKNLAFFFHSCSMLCFKGVAVWPHLQSLGSIIAILFLLKINGTEEMS